MVVEAECSFLSQVVWHINRSLMFRLRPKYQNPKFLSYEICDLRQRYGALV